MYTQILICLCDTTDSDIYIFNLIESTHFVFSFTVHKIQNITINNKDNREKKMGSTHVRLFPLVSYRRVQYIHITYSHISYW